MQTLIKYKMLSGGDGEALIAGVISDLMQAKLALAHAKSLPAGSSADVDSRLQSSDIDPGSLTFINISE